MKLVKKRFNIKEILENNYIIIKEEEDVSNKVSNWQFDKIING